MTDKEAVASADLPQIKIEGRVIRLTNPQPMADGSLREFSFDLDQIKGLDLPAILGTDESQESQHGKEEADGKAEG